MERQMPSACGERLPSDPLWIVLSDDKKVAAGLPIVGAAERRAGGCLAAIWRLFGVFGARCAVSPSPTFFEVRQRCDGDGPPP
jgi:hypothetical protein